MTDPDETALAEYGELLARAREEATGWQPDDPDWESPTGNFIDELATAIETLVLRLDDKQRKLDYIHERGRSGCACRFDADEETLLASCAFHAGELTQARAEAVAAGIVPDGEPEIKFPPVDCRDRNSCHKHRRCMYFGCSALSDAPSSTGAGDGDKS